MTTITTRRERKNRYKNKINRLQPESDLPFYFDNSKSLDIPKSKPVYSMSSSRPFGDNIIAEVPSTKIEKKNDSNLLMKLEAINNELRRENKRLVEQNNLLYRIKILEERLGSPVKKEEAKPERLPIISYIDEKGEVCYRVDCKNKIGLIIN